jgi:hypothetical protein
VDGWRRPLRSRGGTTTTSSWWVPAMDIFSAGLILAVAGWRAFHMGAAGAPEGAK